ncbi:protein ACCELERATED CELL DEATH 6-like [Syzygium oleosum]|uniref:protein ACCELERATED CELL DEATH 6-like n=1 Tax=Syzygium oleosum TaxID=219896 RepID=UPI0011D2253C|nr:protein ACCELERATED CELL DEATH 6-like [Syzygium oleosum]
MDVKLSIGEEDVGTSNSIKEEVKKDEMDSLNEEEIWRSRQERINNALASVRTAAQQDPAELSAAVRTLEHITDVEEFISVIERLANKIDPSAIFNYVGPAGNSLLHAATLPGKDDILRLLLDYVPDHILAAQNDWGNTPLHVATLAKSSRAAAMLIRRTRDLPNVEEKIKILRMKNKHGETALHIAVGTGQVDGVRHLLNEDLELVYMENVQQASPLYSAVRCKDPAMHEVLFSLPLEPSRIQGMPPILNAVLLPGYDVAKRILEKNMKLFAMTDSRGGNVFHLAAYLNRSGVFKLLGPKTEYLVQQQDMNGDLPIHIAGKMGYVDLIEILLPVSQSLNLHGQTVLHVAAKYGRTSVVRYMLKHKVLGMAINDADHAGNTPSHLAAMYSQPAALIPLVIDERIDTHAINDKCWTTWDIALDRYRREPTLRKRLTLMVWASSTIGQLPFASGTFLILRPEARDEANSMLSLRKKKLNRDHVKDLINTRLVMATLVATVTFAAGFAVPGGFNSSDTASKDDRGMATMLHKRLFQVFTICNTIAMFCSMIAVINLIYAQKNDVKVAIVADRHSMLPLAIALPAMSIAFLTGVTLTVGKLPWLANTIFYLGLVFLLILSGAVLIEYLPLLQSNHRPIRRLIFWLVLAYIYLWGVETHLLDDLEDDGMGSRISASQPPDGVGDRMIDGSTTAKCGDTPHPPRH